MGLILNPNNRGQHGLIEYMCNEDVFMLASPVPWFHPGLCRNKGLRPSARTTAAASSSWYSAVSSASLPSEPSPDPGESRAWRAETTLQAPCSWTALHEKTHWDFIILWPMHWDFLLKAWIGTFKMIFCHVLLKTRASCRAGQSSY